MREKSIEIIKEYIKIFLGAVLMAVAVTLFFDAMGVVTGGVTGIAIMLKSTWGIPMWAVNAAINMPLFIVGYWILEKDVFIKTLFGTVSLTVLLGLIPFYDLLTGNMLVDIIIGGAIMGAGLGLIFTAYASSGGTDLLATLVNVKIRHISIPKIMAIIDGIIVAGGVFAFGVEKGIYAIIAVYIVAHVSDGIMEGPNRAKIIYIISDYNEMVAEYIMNTIKRGVTYVNVEGAFTQKGKKMIMCVLSPKEMAKIKHSLYQIDEDAICFVGDIREAFGEGFTKFRG